MPDVAKKVRAIRQMQVNPSLHIGVDGGINLDNVKSVIRDGADVIIAGSAVFNAKSRALAINALRRDERADLYRRRLAGSCYGKDVV